MCTLLCFIHLSHCKTAELVFNSVIIHEHRHDVVIIFRVSANWPNRCVLRRRLFMFGFTICPDHTWTASVLT